MARLQANVYLTIWTDPDFRSLSTDAQWLYFTMLTHESLNYCGVMDWRPARLAGMNEDMTIPRLQRAAWELGQKRMIAVDPDTEEALVRSFVRHDGVLKQPNPTKGLVRQFGGIASLFLMELVAREVRRALEENPDWKGKEHAEPVTKQFTEPFQEGSVWVPDWFEIGSKEVPFLIPQKSANPSEYLPLPLTSTSTTTSPNGEGDANKLATRAPKKKRATQIPENWAPTPGHQKLATELGLNLEWEAGKFVDKATAKGWTYVEWDRAFNNWLRNSREYADRDGIKPVTTEQVNSRKLIAAWRERNGHPPVPAHLFDDPAAANRWAQAFLDGIGLGYTDNQAELTANEAV